MTAEVAEARQAAARAPGDPAPLFRLAALLLAHADPQAAALLPELERFPAFAPGWLALGRALMPGHPVAALVAFNRSTAAAPSLAAESGRAGALLALRRPAEAAAALAACERLIPTDARLPHRRALALRAAGDAAGARAAAERATALDPLSAVSWHALGVICQDAADHAGAAGAFRAALELRPDAHESAFNLGVALQEAGDIEEALDAYARALRTRPDSFGRIAQALVSARVGKLWLDPAALRRELDARP